jgi:hypothetical protein
MACADRAEPLFASWVPHLFSASHALEERRISWRMTKVVVWPFLIASVVGGTVFSSWLGRCLGIHPGFVMLALNLGHLLLSPASSNFSGGTFATGWSKCLSNSERCFANWILSSDMRKPQRDAAFLRG